MASSASSAETALIATAVTVHPQSHNPTEAWKSLEKSGQIVRPLKRNDPNAEPIVPPNRVRFVCISDTHAMQYRMLHPIPDGDVLLHAGDFTRCGHPKEIQDFDNFLGRLPHKHKIVIAGNHELTFDHNMNPDRANALLERFSRGKTHTNTPRTERNEDLITNGVYLEDAETVVHGIKIYGTPWQPEFGGWAFNIPRGKACLDKWNVIPEDTDILLSHTPPLGHGDLCCSGVRAGCAELLATVQQRVKPRFHVFGHIHEGYGITTDGYTAYINCATCTIDFQPNNPPIIFDFPLPAGQTKE